MHASSGPSPWPARAWPLAVRTALLALAASAVVLGSTAAASPSSAAVLALGSAGSVALAAACAAVSAALVQLLLTVLPSREAQQREWTAGSTAIPRAQSPGRPGRPQPRAPGAALLPHRAR